MKKHHILLFLCLITSLVKAQTDSDTWIIRGSDTIACKKVRSSQVIFVGSKLTYITEEGKKIKLSGTKECKKVKTFGKAGGVFDLVPLNPEKPKKYQRYMARVEDGAIRVNQYISSHNYTTESNRVTNTTTNITTVTVEHHTVSAKHVYIKMPSGKYYKFSKGNLKDKIVPYLMKCDIIEEEYGDKKLLLYSYTNVMEMIRQYNSECVEVDE